MNLLYFKLQTNEEKKHTLSTIKFYNFPYSYNLKRLQEIKGLLLLKWSYTF